MLGKLSVFLLLVASPSLAAQAASDIKIDENGQAYKIKKVCRTVEVAGSFIPRQNCTTKKIPVTKPVAENQAASSSGGSSENETAKDSEEQ
jgi:hypothetical protein